MLNPKAKAIISRLRGGSTPPPPALFNEAVDFDRRAIFIAIPKTGTTSIRKQLHKPQPYLIPNPHLNILQIRDGLYTYFLMHALEKNLAFPTAGDVDTDADVRRRASETFTSFFKFSTVRNPWARVVSLYSRREGVQTASELTFEQFCDRLEYASDTCAHPTRHANQLDWLTDEHGSLAVDFVMKLENMGEDLREITKRTEGRVDLVVQDKNRNPGSKSRSYHDLYNDKSRDKIAALFEKDIDTFKYTF